MEVAVAVVVAGPVEVEAPQDGDGRDGQHEHTHQRGEDARRDGGGEGRSCRRPSPRHRDVRDRAGLHEDKWKCGRRQQPGSMPGMSEVV